MNRTDRLTGILLALHGGQRTAADLAAQFEVSRRTILRDLAALSETGVPIVASPGPGGGFALPDSYWLPPLQFSASEATVMLLALQALGSVDRSPFGEPRRTAEEKLRAAIPPDVLAVADRELSYVGYAAPGPVPLTEHVATMREAMRREQWVGVAYQSLRRNAEHELLPRRLYAADGRWYVRAVSLVHAEERTFRLDRINRVTPILDPPGAADAIAAASLPATPYDDPAHPEVVLQLDRAGMTRAADALGVPIHSQAITNDRWQIRFRCPPAELDFYAGVILSLGGHAIAIAPDTLRTQIMTRARQAVVHHSPNDGVDKW